GERRLYVEKGDLTATIAWMPGARLGLAEGLVPGRHGELLRAPALRLWAPGGDARVLGWLLVEGRRRDAAVDLLEGGPPPAGASGGGPHPGGAAGGGPGDERIGVRFDPRRYLVRWEPGAPPRLLLAD